jgi:hypothetical protein
MGERERAQSRARRVKVVSTLFIKTSLKPYGFIGFTCAKPIRFLSVRQETSIKEMVCGWYRNSGKGYEIVTLSLFSYRPT